MHGFAPGALHGMRTPVHAMVTVNEENACDVRARARVGRRAGDSSYAAADAPRRPRPRARFPSHARRLLPRRRRGFALALSRPLRSDVRLPTHAPRTRRGASQHTPTSRYLEPKKSPPLPSAFAAPQWL